MNPSWDKPQKVAGMWSRGGKRPSRREVSREEVIRGQRSMPPAPAAVDTSPVNTSPMDLSKESSFQETVLPSSGTESSPPFTPVNFKQPSVQRSITKTRSREKFEEGLKERLRDSVAWEKPPPAPSGAQMGKRIRPRIPVELDDTGEVVEPRREVWTFPVRGPRSRGSVPMASTGSARDVARRVEETTREFREWAREAADKTVEKSEAGRRAHLAQRNAALALASKKQATTVKSKDTVKQEFTSEAFSVQPVTLQELPKPSPRLSVRSRFKKEKPKDVKEQIQAIFKAMPTLEEKDEGAEQEPSRVMIRMTSPEKGSRPASDADDSSIASTLSPLSSGPPSPRTDDEIREEQVEQKEEPPSEPEPPKTLAQILEQFDLGARKPQPIPDSGRLIPSTPMAEPHSGRPLSSHGRMEVVRTEVRRPDSAATKSEAETSMKGKLQTLESENTEPPIEEETAGQRVIRDSMRVLEESRRVLKEPPRWPEFYRKSEDKVPGIIQQNTEEVSEQGLGVSKEEMQEALSTTKSAQQEEVVVKSPKSPRRKSVDVKPRTPISPPKPTSPLPRSPLSPIPGGVPTPRNTRNTEGLARSPIRGNPVKTIIQRPTSRGIRSPPKTPRISPRLDIPLKPLSPNIVGTSNAGETTLRQSENILKQLPLDRIVKPKTNQELSKQSEATALGVSKTLDDTLKSSTSPRDSPKSINSPRKTMIPASQENKGFAKLTKPSSPGRNIKDDTMEVEIHEIEDDILRAVQPAAFSVVDVPEITSAVIVEREISNKSGGVDIYGQGTKTFIRRGQSRDPIKSPDHPSEKSIDPSVSGALRRGGPQAFESVMAIAAARGDLTSAVVLGETPQPSQTNYDQDVPVEVDASPIFEEVYSTISGNPDDQDYSDEEEEVEVKKRGKPKWFKEYGIGLDDSEGDMSEEVSEESSIQEVEKASAIADHIAEPSVVVGESGMTIGMEEKSSERSVCHSVEEDSTKLEAKSLDIIMASTVPLVQAEQVLEPVDDLKTQTEDTTQYSDYLKTSIGRYLVRGLVQVLVYKPIDPIDYLAHWLHAERDREDKAASIIEERERLQEMRNVINMERQEESVMEQAMAYLATTEPTCLDLDMMDYGEEEGDEEEDEEEEHDNEQGGKNELEIDSSELMT